MLGKRPSGRIRTRTDAILSRVPLLLGYGGKKKNASCRCRPGFSALEARRPMLVDE